LPGIFRSHFPASSRLVKNVSATGVRAEEDADAPSGSDPECDPFGSPTA
jgi:hypothetical protein